jgi:suppressor for copper-sensitivity B
MARFLLILHLLLLVVAPAVAGDPVSMTLIPGRYEQGSTIAYFGLKVTLDKGWHTYWKSPGEGGLPLALKVDRGSNAVGVSLLWPAPSIVRSLGADTIGYESEVVFPLAVPMRRIGDPVEIFLDVTLYACSNICVPFKQELAATNVVHASPTLKSIEVDQWIKKVPMQAGSKSGVRAIYDSATGQLTVDPAKLGVTNYSQLFLDTGLDYAAPPLYGTPGSEQRFLVKGLNDGKRGNALDKVHLVVVDEGIPREYALSLQAPGTLSVAMLITAFIGGLILNLMPCVLPVLSLKLLSFTKEPQQVRRSFLWSALGIWASFLALGLAILLLKAAGATIGWGLQFQSPAFLVVMSLVTMIFAISMVDGIFLYLPARLSNVASKVSTGSGAGASFLQGFVATLLATPCSAPFVGTAAGFAFAAPALPLLVIFVAMGLGMALPYILIAAIPSVQRLVPRPGRWMALLKVVLATLMAGTSGYLASLVGATWSDDASYILVVALFGAVGLFIRKRSLFAALTVAMLAYPVWDKLAAPVETKTTPWVAFDPARIGALVRDGKTVVVDVTAKWCITCKVNDETVWNRKDVLEALSGVNVVAMRGDWTKPNAGIAAYLKSFNRYGLPFNAVYSSSHPGGVVLPELLSRKDIFDALSQPPK